MKHLKQYEYWTTDTTSDLDVVYGDIPKISKEIKKLISYIKNNEYSLYAGNDYELTFPKCDGFITKIEYDGSILKIFAGDDNKLIMHHITSDERDYLNKYFDNLNMEHKISRNKNDRINDLTDQTKIDAKKYNV